jgi:hypothetical protein
LNLTFVIVFLRTEKGYTALLPVRPRFGKNV